MADPLGDSRRHGGRSVPLSLFRVQPGRTVRVRMLTSGAILGFRIHWRKDGSDYCCPETCFPKCGGFKAEWKGYLPVHRWDQGVNCWTPCVLEITEHCDHDIGGFVTRGQVWAITREPKRPRKASKLSAEYVEQLDARQLGGAFDMLPVLNHLWRGVSLRIDMPNPVPPRPRAEVEEGEPPMIDIPAPEEAPATPAVPMAELLRTGRKATEFIKAHERNGHAEE